MKKVLFLLIALCASACQLRNNEGIPAQQQATSVAEMFASDNTPEEKKVYICTGSSSKRYHSRKDCRGLSNCGGTIKEITMEQAEKQGRTPCKICCPQ